MYNVFMPRRLTPTLASCCSGGVDTEEKMMEEMALVDTSEDSNSENERESSHHEPILERAATLDREDHLRKATHSLLKEFEDRGTM